MNLGSYLGVTQITELARYTAQGITQFAIPISLGAGAYGLNGLTGGTTGSRTLVGATVTLGTGAVAALWDQVKWGIQPWIAMAAKAATVMGSTFDLGNEIIICAKKLIQETTPHATRLIVKTLEYGSEHPEYLYITVTAISVGGAALICLKMANYKEEEVSAPAEPPKELAPQQRRPQTRSMKKASGLTR